MKLFNLSQERYFLQQESSKEEADRIIDEKHSSMLVKFGTTDEDLQKSFADFDELSLKEQIELIFYFLDRPNSEAVFLASQNLWKQSFYAREIRELMLMIREANRLNTDSLVTVTNKKGESKIRVANSLRAKENADIFDKTTPFTNQTEEEKFKFCRLVLICPFQGHTVFNAIRDENEMLYYLEIVSELMYKKNSINIIEDALKYNIGIERQSKIDELFS